LSRFKAGHRKPTLDETEPAAEVIVGCCGMLAPSLQAVVSTAQDD
jgi:hypothetical protein